MYTNQARHFQFPFHTGHHIHRIGTADTDSNHTQTTCIGCMRVRSYHHSTRKCIIFQYYLMYNTRTQLPETDTVSGRNITQEIVYFFICLGSSGNIFPSSSIGLYQMVAMYCRRYGNLFATCIHKLQQCHLCGCILHCYTVRAEVYIIFSPFVVFYSLLIKQMSIQNLFC